MVLSLPNSYSTAASPHVAFFASAAALDGFAPATGRDGFALIVSCRFVLAPGSGTVIAARRLWPQGGPDETL